MLSTLFVAITLAATALGASVPLKREAADDLSQANFWFAFGDSYTARGFSTSGTVPAPGNPFGNPDYPGQTGIGSNWIDYDTVQLNRSLILTYDYAVGGATINTQLVPPTLATQDFIQQVESFLDQVGWWKPPTAPWTSQNAMFSIWFGINDINNSYDNGGDRGAFSDQLIDQYFQQVQRLVSCPASVFAVGARNFLFIGVPPIYRTPHMLAKSDSERSLQKSVMDGYNYRLAVRVHSWAAQYSDVNAWIWDANVGFNTILDNYQQYGFTDITHYGDAENDFWGNDFHPGWKAHAIFAQQVVDTLANTIWL